MRVPRAKRACTRVPVSCNRLLGAILVLAGAIGRAPCRVDPRSEPAEEDKLLGRCVFGQTTFQRVSPRVTNGHVDPLKQLDEPFLFTSTTLGREVCEAEYRSV